MKDIVLFGMPGSGKGTQAELILQQFGGELTHLSTGDVFRALSSQKNAIGDYVKDKMEAGLYINDDVTISLFNAYFHSVRDEGKYMLLDGYPRTINQLNAFLALAKQYNREVIGLFFVLEDTEAVKRMLGRGRAGETEEILQVRLREYYDKTQPLVDAFAQQATLVTIDASPSIQDVYARVLDVLA